VYGGGTHGVGVDSVKLENNGEQKQRLSR